jgi:hypothetical protein
MGATILTVSSTKRLSLTNSQILRRPVYLNNWTSMRIGIHFYIPASANVTGTPRLWMGIGSGLTAGIGDSTTTNWIGVYTDTATMTHTLSGAQHYTGGNSIRMVKKVGVTVTPHATGVITANAFFSMDAAFRALIMIDITKGSPNYSLTLGYINSNSGLIGIDVSPTLMDSYMGLPLGMAGIGTVGNPNYGNLTTNGTLAMSEVAGNLDCIQIYWDKTSAPLELEGVYHRKLA